MSILITRAVGDWSMGRASSGHWALERHDYGALPVAGNRSASSTSDRRCAEGAARSMGSGLFHAFVPRSYFVKVLG